MKIERINHYQIRCTLTKHDLQERNLHLSEFSSESENVKNLFQDMMRQAHLEVGFDINGSPLMIEAMPSDDSVILVITKVNDIDVKKRMSKFYDDEDELALFDEAEALDGADRITDVLEDMRRNFEKLKAQGGIHSSTLENLKLFVFTTMEAVIKACRFVGSLYTGNNSLYKDELSDVYILALTKGGMTTADFERVSNMLSEYSTPDTANGVVLAFLEEHCEVLIAKDAVGKLGLR